MLSINTNLSSLIAQGSMKQSTNKLNQAIERMTTGYKINHAKDNAANYSISTNMTTKIGAYNVAEDNAAMGLDMITTATENLGLIEEQLIRLRDLAEQASNGTYGEQSLSAIQNEANARVEEINRIVGTTEYNGVSMFEGEPDLSKLELIKEVTPLTEEEALALGYKIIKTADELQAMSGGRKYILMNDIDLEGYDWEPIAVVSELNGNGYTISNLTINRPDEDNVGLFGDPSPFMNASVKNLILKDVYVVGNNNVGGLVGLGKNKMTIDNVAVSGTVIAKGTNIGLLAGYLDECGNVSNCYTKGSIEGSIETSGFVGGLIGYCIWSDVENCYSTANVKGGTRVGGLIGYTGDPVTNSYATGNVTGKYVVGGLIGDNNGSEITNCYATGDVTGTMINTAYNPGWGYCEVGGLVGKGFGKATNCYSSGKINIPQKDGVTVYDAYCFWGGQSSITITECYWDKEAAGLSRAGAKNSPEGLKGVTTEELNDIIEKGNWIKEQEISIAYKPVHFQVGVSARDSATISLNISFALTVPEIDMSTSEKAREVLTQIDNWLNKINAKAVEYGAAENRLESALNEIVVQRENLISSRSTIKDADIAKVSSSYIQHQILQQASATLLATANQSPSIALQLI